MNTRIFDAFNKREEKVKEYMAGCGARYGMRCTCGPGCRCKNCSCGNQNYEPQQQQGSGCCQSSVDNDLSTGGHNLEGIGNSAEDAGQSNFNNNHLNADHQMDFSQFPMGPPAPIERQNIDPISMMQVQPRRPAPTPHFSNPQTAQVAPRNADQVVQNQSVQSYGNIGPRSSIRNSIRNSIRGMSITSETTFGRAMSGLSALSIDWENLDDFDVEVDHSAHVNNGSPSGNQGPRRASIRRSVMSNGSSDAQVAFKV